MSANPDNNRSCRTSPLTRELLSDVYDVLVNVCGAPANQSDRDSFLRHQAQAEDGYPREWRFYSSLGFGGKFWRDHGRIYVTCYREDETAERLAMIEKANERIAAVLKP
jgi:hypothetical protein